MTDNGYIFSLFFVGYVVVGIPAGLVSDRFKPNRIAGLGLFGTGIALIFGGIAPNLEAEYAASLLLGLCAGWISPGTIKIVTDLFPKRNERTVAIGYFSLAWPLSVILLGVLLPPLVLRVGWREAYYVLTAVTVIIGVLLFFSTDENFKPQMVSLSFFVNRNAAIVAIGGFTFYFAYWAVVLFSYDYFLHVGLNAYEAGVCVSALAILGLPSTLLSGFVMNKLGIRQTMVYSIAIYGILTLLFASTSSFYLILAIALGMGFFRFIITPANTTIIAVLGEDKAASLSGFSTLFWQSSGIVASIVAAYLIANLGYTLNWYVIAAIVFLSAALYSMLSIPQATIITETPG